ncbi:MAG: PQQ-binding-like beta-propeller repeat protein [Halorientalis sp.]
MWKPSRRTLLQSIGGAGVLGVASHAIQGTRTQQDSAESWPRPRYDAVHSGYAPANTAPDGDITVAWTTHIESRRDFPRVIADGTWFRATPDGELIASSLADGAERWWVEFEADSVSIFAAFEGTVYVQTSDDADSGVPTVHALSTADGTERWHGRGGVTTITDNLAYRTADGLAAVSVPDQRGQWRIAGQFSGVSVGDGTVYTVGTRDTGDESSRSPDRVFAVSASDGSLRWDFQPPGNELSTPVVRDGTVYVGTSAGLVYAVSATDGTVQWKTVFDASTAPVVTDDTVFVMNGKTLSARSRDDGSERWRHTATYTSSAPIVVGDTVFVGTSEGLSALAAADGAEQWHFETQWPVTQSPAVVDGTVLFVARDPRPKPGGTVYALRGASPETTTSQSTTQESQTPSTTHTSTRTTHRTPTDSSTPPDTITPPTASEPANDISATEVSRTGTTGAEGPGFGLVTTLAGLGLGGWRILENNDDDEDE